jgi:hypothetical protein
MTSVLRRYAQIEPRIKYFSVLSADVDMWNLNPQSPTSSLMEVSEFVNSYSPTTVSITYTNLQSLPLLQDLGRQITVYDNTTSGIIGSPHIALFRQVLWVNGLDTEGINIDASGNVQNMGYICVWTDVTPYRNVSPPFNFTVAAVARTG